MSPAARRPHAATDSKICAYCGTDNPIDATHCHECDEEFGLRQSPMKGCSKCGALNPLSAKKCQDCGADFGHEFEISLKEALRVGAIIRGMDLDEEEVREGEVIGDDLREAVLKSGDDHLIKILRQLPEESYGRLTSLLSQARKDGDRRGYAEARR